MNVRKTHLVVVSLVLACCVIFQQPASASPFGAGVFGEDVPFGSETSIAISLSNNTGLMLELTGQSFSGTGTHTVTVASTDVVGYKLYVNATSATSMSNGSDTVAASDNSNAAPLAVNSWGYNTTGSSSNFKGITLSQALIKDADGPYKSGDDTTVTYGAVIDRVKSSGVYTVDVTYTAVGES